MNLSKEIVQVHEYKKHGCITCGFQNPIRPTDVILVKDVREFVTEILSEELGGADLFIKIRALAGDALCVEDVE